MASVNQTASKQIAWVLAGVGTDSTPRDGGLPGFFGAKSTCYVCTSLYDTIHYGLEW
jgi:hypothetical protein